MSTGILAILSLLPIISVAIFLVILRWPASKAMPIAYVVAAALALFVWQLPMTKILAASVNGLIIAGTLIYIIFGAILLLEANCKCEPTVGKYLPLKFPKTSLLY